MVYFDHPLEMSSLLASSGFTCHRTAVMCTCKRPCDITIVNKKRYRLNKMVSAAKQQIFGTAHVRSHISYAGLCHHYRNVVRSLNCKTKNPLMTKRLHSNNCIKLCNLEKTYFPIFIFKRKTFQNVILT